MSHIKPVTKRVIFGLCSAFALLIALSCGSDKGEDGPHAIFLDDIGINIDRQLLLGDTLCLPDVYCGDPKQTADDFKGLKINQEQYDALIAPVGNGIPDDMSNWMLLGVRFLEGDITLAAFYAGSGLGYSVDLITYDKQGHFLDAINTREQHLVWRINQTDPDDGDSFAIDSHITLEPDGLTLHRVMKRCDMDYQHDLKGAPRWQQAWQQTYRINAKGHFVLQGQQITQEQGPIDRYATMDFMTWDMLVCSLYDTDVMDTWNDYAARVDTVYGPDYEFNPFPVDVNQLYKMNPQRFLSWLSRPDNRHCNLLKYFKLKKEDRPAMLKEVAHVTDADARRWLTSLVNTWDDTPLTQHL